MWASSMPCGLPTDETIPLGRYGSSNVGRAKSVYRMGLGHRYGRRMQTISGVTTTGRCRAWTTPATLR
jgi:glutamate--cysteine ligase